MNRRHGLVASLLVVVFAFAGAAAGPSRVIETRRLVVSIAWRSAEPATVSVRRHTRQVALPAPILRPPEGMRLQALVRGTALDRWLFQRPPPAAI